MRTESQGQYKPPIHLHSRALSWALTSLLYFISLDEVKWWKKMEIVTYSVPIIIVMIIVISIILTCSTSSPGFRHLGSKSCSSCLSLHFWCLLHSPSKLFMLMIEKTAEGCYKVISACKGRDVEEDKSILINNQANLLKRRAWWWSQQKD